MNVWEKMEEAIPRRTLISTPLNLYVNVTVHAVVTLMVKFWVLGR
jgi:hypothetical protein